MVNVDLVGSAAELYWDVRRRLPFDDGSVSVVFSEHMLEHLDIDAAYAFIRECRRVLAPGGIVRIGVPNFELYAASYANDGPFIETARPGRPTALLAVSEVVYEFGHRSIWDSTTLCLFLDAVGFVGAQPRSFGLSAIDPCPDSPRRRNETLYVEATVCRDDPTAEQPA